MSVPAAGKIGSSVVVKGWAASCAVHVAMLSMLVGWQGPPPESPWLHSHFGQTSLLISAADPTPGDPDATDTLAEPFAVERVNEVDVTEAAPLVRLAEIRPDNPLSLLPPQAALEPIEEPRPEQPEPPPLGDKTPTASSPPGQVGNDQPSEPEFESNPPILYPPVAMRDGVEGTVLLRIRIGTDGDVVNVELVQSSGSSILDRAAIEGVRTWHGRPAQLAGQAIEAAALLPVVFRLH